MAGNKIRKSWKIGELATETGLTVRTLHYYDKLGLLTPSQETEGGHRLYTRGDVEKLQKVVTMKQLGFTLEKIKEAIAKPEFSLRSATAQLLSEVEKRKSDLQELETRLKDAERFQTGSEAPAEQVLQLLSRMSLFDRCLTEDQREWIKEHDLKFGPEKLSELRREWILATEALQKAMADRPSSHWRTKAICARWFGLACAFTGGSMEWVYDLKRIAEEDPAAAAQLGIPGVDLKRLFEFVELIFAEAEKYPYPRSLAYARVGVRDLDKARRFYDQLLGALELQPLFHHPTEVVYGMTNPELFISTETRDGQPVDPGNAGYVGFWASSVEAVDACYKSGLEAGGKSLRVPAWQGSNLYSFDMEDLDGNVLEIMRWVDNPDRPTG